MKFAFCPYSLNRKQIRHSLLNSSAEELRVFKRILNQEDERVSVLPNRRLGPFTHAFENPAAESPVVAVTSTPALRVRCDLPKSGGRKYAASQAYTAITQSVVAGRNGLRMTRRY